MYYTILGLEEFISTAEADRIKFQEKENIFMELLPYAMAFKVADKWSKAFKELNKPDWFESNDPNFSTFNAYYFISSINNLSSNMNETLKASPRSSGSGGSWSGGSGFGGGGFSGGGFGGGGGGSW